jgi:hypothetical protein
LSSGLINLANDMDKERAVVWAVMDSAFWNDLINLHLLNTNMPPVMRATFPANKGPTPVSVLSVHYCFELEKLIQHLEDKVGDGKIKLA